MQWREYSCLSVDLLKNKSEMVYSNFKNSFKEISMHSLTILQFPDLKLKFVGHTLKNVIETVNKRTLCWKNICILNALVFRLKIKTK